MIRQRARIKRGGQKIKSERNDGQFPHLIKLTFLIPILILFAIWVRAFIHFAHVILAENSSIKDSPKGKNFNLGGATNFYLRQINTSDPMTSRLMQQQQSHSTSLPNNAKFNHAAIPPSQYQQTTRSNQSPSHLILLSRSPLVTITSSVRGNLGPSTVLNQDPPGNDWIKDRWQAASDMGGTAIKGSHWVMLDFTHLLENSGKRSYNIENAISISKVVLDWEAAFARNYVIEGRMDPPTGNNINNHVDDEGGGWCVFYDGSLDSDMPREKVQHEHQLQNHPKNLHLNQQPNRVSVESGQSPGVKQKMPLHIVHTINWGNYVNEEEESRRCRTLRFLRIFIRRPARGWGVSLWEVDVYGSLVSA
mmetsp:Transcript_33898/g.69059  ORF Transcript_33898/g.69059 Transcript_33898/m.69059 type:complete len:363 (+) Transcript_33898:256-1344(+)